MQPANKPTRTFVYRPHPHLYEINTWAWLVQLSRRRGRRITLGEVPDEEWDTLKNLGFDFIWLMGVWKRSARGQRISRTDPRSLPLYEAALPGWKRSQVVGSPYSIQAYYPDPRIGTWEQFEQVRRKLHARGMGLVLDYVPNHTALDHPWITSHPEYYVQGTEDDFRLNPTAFFPVARPDQGTLYIARGRDPFFPPWTDTAQLNYIHPATRTAMIGELYKIGQRCDGVRCDMAMLVLNEVFTRTWGGLVTTVELPKREFWAEARNAVPGLVWIAEVYWNMERRLQELGFEFTYDKGFYDCLRGAIPQEIYQYLKADFNYQRCLVRFLENHDEGRSAAVFGKERLAAVATLAATLPGIRFYHQGQLEGKQIRLPIQMSEAAEEVPDPAFRRFYEKILRITHEEIFHIGRWQLLEVRSAGDGTFENLIAYWWRAEGVWKVIVVNLSGEPAQGRIYLSEEIQPSRQYFFLDQLNDQTYEWNGNDLVQEGLYVRLKGNRVHLFAVFPGQATCGSPKWNRNPRSAQEATLH